jgi:hypothetical protein
MFLASLAALTIVSTLGVGMAVLHRRRSGELKSIWMSSGFHALLLIFCLTMWSTCYRRQVVCWVIDRTTGGTISFDSHFNWFGRLWIPDYIAQEDKLIPFHLTSRLLGWDWGDRVGYCDRSGKIVVPADRYAKVFEVVDGRGVVIGSNGLFGVVGEDGNEIVATQYAKLGTRYRAGRLPVRHNGKWGFLDRDGHLVIPADYDAVGEFHSGLAAVNLDNESTNQVDRGRWGYIDRSGAVVIPLRFAFAEPFQRDRARVVL